MKYLQISAITGIAIAMLVAGISILSIRNDAFADLPQSQLSQTVAFGSHVYVTWTEISNGTSSVMFAQSSDYGATFRKTIKLADDIGIVPRKMAASGNNVYLAWGVDTKNGHGIFLRKSTDYGNTFGLPVMLNNPDKLCNSVTGLQAIDSDVYVFFNCYDAISQQGSVIFRASHDNATTFGNPITLFQGKGIASNGPLSTSVQGKNIYTVSEEKFPVSTPDSVFFRKSTDGGSTFSDKMDLSNSTDSHTFPQVISSENHVYVTWIDYRNSNLDQLMYRKSDDYGSTFGSLVKLNAAKQDTEMYNIPFLQARGENVYISWEEIHQGPVQTQYQLLRVSTDGGNNFGPEQNLTGVISMRYDLRQGGFVLGPGQNMYYLYPGTANPVFDIPGVYFKKSDGEKNFGEPIDLNKINSTPHGVFDPQITVSGNNVYVTGDAAIQNGNGIYIVSSHDNGTTFGRIVDINSNEYGMAEKAVSPLVQLHLGIAYQNVKCQDGLELVISSKQLPACVRHDHLPRLLSHGWSYGVDDIADAASKKMQDIIVIGDKIREGDGLVPVTITEIINHAESLDSVMDWNFIPIGYNGDNRGTSWDFIPNSYPLPSGVVDGQGHDVIDKSRMPANFGITDELRIYPAICGSIQVMGEGGHPFSLPITKGNSVVLVHSGGRGILPDSSGQYVVNFVSLFDTKVEFPKDAQVISNETQSCFLEHKMDNFTRAFYTKAVFRIG